MIFSTRDAYAVFDLILVRHMACEIHIVETDTKNLDRQIARLTIKRHFRDLAADLQYLFDGRS